MAVKPQYVQTKTGTGGAGSTTLAVTWDSNTTTGNIIVVVVSSTNSTVTDVASIDDSQGNTYSPAAQNTDSVDVEIWYSNAITGGTTPTVTVTLSNSSSSGSIMAAYEYAGGLTGIDGGGTGNNASGTTVSTSNIPMNYDRSLAIAAAAPNLVTTVTPSAPFGDAVTVTGGAHALGVASWMVNPKTTISASFTVGNLSAIGAALTTIYFPARGSGLEPSVVTRPAMFKPGLAR